MAFAATGFRAGDVVVNTLAYHLTPGGFMLDSGLRSMGCVVISAGVGQTDLQVKAASHSRATGYAGTPSFLRTLLHHARELNLPLAIEVAFATAEMLPESLRNELETDFGIRVLQGYATADLGVLAYECPEKNGMHLQPECIVEILDLETGKPAAPGEPGHVVGTTFDSAYPLLRFATGDVSALASDTPCPCGRTAPRLKGLLGRVGDAIKVKGMFVRASMIDEVMKRFPAVTRFQTVVTREQHQDHLVYLVELAAAADSSALAEALREAVKVRGDVQIVPAGTIAANAPKLDDRRVWK
jgi:phenylacetate-CoA ligase